MSRHGKRGNTIGVGGPVHGGNHRLISLFSIVEPVQAPEDLTWQDAALCGEVGPEVFFGEQGDSTTAARSVCAGCVVRRECLTDALSRMGEYGTGKHGVWGGTSPEQRIWLLESFADVPAAVAYAMDQDCTITTLTMQPRKAVAA